PTLVEPAEKNWCVAFCACHSDELAGNLPADLSVLDGLYDYCVIRLKSTPGLERGNARLDMRAVVPAADAPILVLQHPAGASMRHDQSVIAQPALYSNAAQIPALRFVHLANALPGSSGGPCFDSTFSLIGFHQGAWNARAAQSANRGVPIVK